MGPEENPEVSVSSAACSNDLYRVQFPLPSHHGVLLSSMPYPGGIDVQVEHLHGDKETPSVSDEKSYHDKQDVEAASIEVESTEGVLQDERAIATHVISLSDDPSLNPWTFRAFFIGIGLSAFGGVLGTSHSSREALTHHFLQLRYTISNR